jgi:hypothetical protein
MSVIITYPKLRLAQQLKESAGSTTVAEAVASANNNLENIRENCLAELQAAASAAAAAFQSFPAAFDAAPLRDLYGIASRAVGIGAVCGAPGADAALASLCDLLDRLSTSGRWDLQAIAVHVQTLQLLSSDAGQGLDEASVKHVLAGLQKVSGRYAPPAAAAAG